MESTDSRRKGFLTLPSGSAFFHKQVPTRQRKDAITINPWDGSGYSPPG